MGGTTGTGGITGTTVSGETIPSPTNTVNTPSASAVSTPTPTLNFRITVPSAPPTSLPPPSTSTPTTRPTTTYPTVHLIAKPKNTVPQTTTTLHTIVAAQFGTIPDDSFVSSLNPLYYVITALMASIVCVSCLMVCWVRHHQTHYKEQLHVIDLKDNAECAMSPPTMPMIGPAVVPEVRALVNTNDPNNTNGKMITNGNTTRIATIHSHDTCTLQQPQLTQITQLTHGNINGVRRHLSRYGSESALTAPTSYKSGDTEWMAPTTVKSGDTEVYAPTTVSGDTRRQSSASSSECASSTEASSTSSCSASSECGQSRVHRNGNGNGDQNESGNVKGNDDCLERKEVHYETDGDLLEQEPDHYVDEDEDQDEDGNDEESPLRDGDLDDITGNPDHELIDVDPEHYNHYGEMERAEGSGVI